MAGTQNWWEDAPLVTDAPVAAPGPLLGPPPKAEKPDKPPEPKTTYRTLTPVEAAARGLPPGKTYQESSEGKLDALAGAGEGGDGSKDVMREANLDSIVGQINRVQDLYNKGIRDETLSNAFGLLDSIGPAAGQFDAAGQAIADQGLASFRVPGVGAQSDMEARQFALANTPQSGDWDTAIEEKLRTIRARVDANRAARGLPPAEWAGIADKRETDPAVAGAIAPTAGGQPPMNAAEAGNIPGGGAGGGLALAAPHAATKTVTDPTLAGIRNEYVARLAKSQSADQLAAWLGSVGITDPHTIAQVRRQAVYRRRFPNVPIGDYPVVISKEVPLTATDKALNSAAQSAPGAYAVGAANFLSGNTLDTMAGAMGGNAERTRLGMGALADQHPVATTLGEISGGAMSSVAGELGLARLGVPASIGRGMAADMFMGGANGAGAADDGSRLVGAGKGAAAALVGDLGARVVTKGVAGMISPSGGSMADLYAAGVRPSIGQRVANANGGKGIRGLVGKAINATEEGLQSVPFIGSGIRGAREEARDQFQVGAFNEALKEIGEQLPKGVGPGNQAHAHAQTVFNRIYDQARGGMQVVADQQLANDVQALAPDIATLGPAAQNKLKAIMANSVNNRIATGTMNGAGFKQATSDLGKHIARLGKSAMAEDQQLADVLRGIKAGLDSAARRHSAPDAVALLDAADAGYAKLVRIEEASARRGGDSGTFTPTQFDSAVQKTSGGVRSKAYLRGDALMQDYANAGKGLVDRMPNSGTTDRALIAGGLGTAAVGYLNPKIALILGVIGGAYAPGVRKLTKGAMAPGGPTSKAIASQLEKRSRLLGKLGAGSAVAALPAGTPGQ